MTDVWFIAFGVIFIPLSLVSIGVTFKNPMIPFFVAAISASAVLVNGMKSPYVQDAASEAGIGDVQMASMSATLAFIMIAMLLCSAMIAMKKVTGFFEKDRG